jgi:uncharacterized repeat protein (TIGR03803 family)
MNLASVALTVVVRCFIPLALLGAATAQPAFGQYSVLANLGEHKSAAFPKGGVILASDGDFYGTTTQGGDNGQGTVFRMTADGVVTILHSFSFAITNGAFPSAALVEATPGVLYGTTSAGGANNAGTVFKITAEGTFTLIHSFAGNPFPEGSNPQAPLMKASDGNLYSTTFSGACGGESGGSVFRIASDVFAVVGCLNVSNGLGAGALIGLVEGPDGRLYGATHTGNGSGAIYAYSLDDSSISALHGFTLESGYAPMGEMVVGTDGALYGTNSEGGSQPCEGRPCGTVFRYDPVGDAYTVLRSFHVDGPRNPAAGLTLGSDGFLYGTTSHHGRLTSPSGSIFRLLPDGSRFSVLHIFNPNNPLQGRGPGGELLESPTGRLVGTTYNGGSSGDAGVVFALQMSRLSKLTFATTIAGGCQDVIATVKLTAISPVGGTIIDLENTNGAATIPASVTVPAGKTNAKFNITSVAVAAATSGTIRATLGTLIESRNLTVRPIGVKSIVLNPNPVIGGNSSFATVKLECAAAPGDITATLSSSNPDIAAPVVPSVVFSAGATQKTVEVTTADVTVPSTAKISATANGVKKTKMLTVNP